MAAPILASWAVNGFFAISGYLIAGSRIRLTLGKYFARRSRRIMPGFWVMLVVVAFGFAPLYAALTGDHWSPVSSLRYVIGNAGLLITQPDIAGIERNAPLWTLAYEAGCYIAFGLLLSLEFVRRHGAIVCAALLVALMALHPIVTPADHGLVGASVRLGSFFTAGALCWFLRDRIPARWWVMVSAAAIVAVLSVVADGQWYGQLPAAMALLTAGALLPIRVGVKNDVSYGVYIYGWPVQQTLLAIGAADFGVYAFLALSLVLVLPFAWGSWLLVERRWQHPQRRGADAWLTSARS